MAIKNQWNIFVTQELLPAGRSILEAAAKVTYSPHDRPLTEDEVIELAGDADALVSPFAEPNRIFSEKVISRLPNLKALGWVGAGFDHIDLDAATKRGIYVSCNDVQSATVADQVFALMLSAARRIVPAANAVKRGDWERQGYRMYSQFMGRNVHHKTLGIVGLGRIGTEVARRARGFDMEILYTDEHPRAELERDFRITKVDFTELLKESDFIACCVPLNNATNKMFGRQEFSLMKPECIFINASRGKCADTDALYDALKRGIIERAALDVIDPEPVPSTHPLLQLSNFLLVPHIAAITHETETLRHCAVAEETIRTLSGFRPRKLLNPAVLAVRLLPSDV
ncbi:D-glycerate dehydrogenase [Bradyrhizobium sp. LA6.7]|uniref:2-hydroxyacid dehydrogenase n=1 Tax=unclassified Bradyrhizobium TaxID=2631580 RepID=UPI0033961F8F